MFQNKNKQTSPNQKQSLKEIFTKENVSIMIFVGSLLFNILGAVFLLKPQYQAFKDVKEEVVLVEELILQKQSELVRLQEVANPKVLGERDSQDEYKIPDEYYVSQLVQWVAEVAEENNQIQPVNFTVTPLIQHADFPLLQSQSIELNLIMPEYLVQSFINVVEQETDQIYSISGVNIDQNSAVSEDQILDASVNVTYNIETFYASGDNIIPVEVEVEEEVFNPFSEVKH